ncbi:30S ribosomal protein S20 [Candidatus Saccharibacteria bacterium]|nr:30S ribosomal protein S20 [Candidatus Saccharibacteria bacterium]
MPIIKSAIKRAKQALVHKERNQATKRDIKSAVKAFEAKPSATTLSAAHGAIDTAVKKNILEKRTAARRKASLSKRAQEAGVKLASCTKKAANAKPAAKTTAKPAVKPAAKPKAAVKKPTAKKATATK